MKLCRFKAGVGQPVVYPLRFGRESWPGSAKPLQPFGMASSNSLQVYLQEIAWPVGSHVVFDLKVAWHIPMEPGLDR